MAMRLPWLAWVAGVCALSGFMLFSACRKQGEITPADKEVTTPSTLQVHAGFPPMTFRPDNPLTEEGVALGRRLYYDALLHPDQLVSCASCHRQEEGFTLAGSPVLPHVNLGWNTHFFWGMAPGVLQGDMEEVCLFEVREFFGTPMHRLNNHPDYPGLFRKAFDVGEIGEKEVAYALAQFMRTQVSWRSRYDSLMWDTSGRFWPTDAELRGYAIFFSEKGDCFHCHGSVFLTDNQYHNIGLDTAFAGSSLGLYQTTGSMADMGKFKTPTLRNVALRQHYMHDGRFRTLEEVVRFYQSGVKHSPTLDPIMTKPGKQNGLNLSDQDVEDLVAFLHMFTDQAFLGDTTLAKPFR